MTADAEITAIYGRRGSGKTTRVRALLRNRRRVIVFDPIGEYPAYGFRAVTWAGLARVLSEVRAGPFQVSYTPKSRAEPEALHYLSRALVEYQRVMAASAGQVTLVVEEMALSFPVERLPLDLHGFKSVCERGRHWGVNIIGTTQRPATVSTVFRGNAAETYIFALDWETDVAAVCAMIGREHRDALRGMEPHRYLYYREGRLTHGRNRRPRKER